MNHSFLFAALVFGLPLIAPGLQAGQLKPETQVLVDARISEVARWAIDSSLVDAVARQNSSHPEILADLSQEKWKLLPLTHPAVSSLIDNKAAAFLRAHQGAWMSEAFVSDATGRKVAFLTKPTSWSHAGKPKHEVPMTGHTWQGEIEIDASVGTRQLQIAVPILQEGKPIGSLVVGLNLMELGSGTMQ